MTENSIIRYVAFRQNGQITAVGTVHAAALPALSAALALDGVSVAEIAAGLDVQAGDSFYDTATGTMAAIPPRPALPNGNFLHANVPQYIPAPDGSDYLVQSYRGPWHSFDFDAKEWVPMEDWAWDEIYAIQQAGLKNTDAYMLADARNWNLPGFEELWDAYRNSLRAATSAADPLTLVWPQLPTK